MRSRLFSSWCSLPVVVVLVVVVVETVEVVVEGPVYRVVGTVEVVDVVVA